MHHREACHDPSTTRNETDEPFEILSVIIIHIVCMLLKKTMNFRILI